MDNLVTVTLGRTYTWQDSDGEPEKFYGPGTVEVPSALAVVLQRIGAIIDTSNEDNATLKRAGRKSSEADNGTQSNTQ